MSWDAWLRGAWQEEAEEDTMSYQTTADYALTADCGKLNLGAVVCKSSWAVEKTLWAAVLSQVHSMNCGAADGRTPGRRLQGSYWGI